MSLRLFWILAAAALILFGGSASAIEYIYHGNVPPETPDSAGPGYTFVRFDGSETGTIVCDPEAVDGLALHVNDLSGPGGPEGAKVGWRTQPSRNISSARGATVVGRIKALSDVAGGGIIGIQDPGGLSCWYHWGGPTGHIKETERGNQTYVTGDTNYHILRLTAVGGSGKTVDPNTHKWIETFTYDPPGCLNGRGDWIGPATDCAINVTPGYTLRIDASGAPPESAIQNVVAIPESNLITVSLKIKPGAGTDTFWSFYVFDAAGVEFGRWYGAGTWVRGRVLQTASDYIYPAADWNNTLVMKIHTDINQTDFIYNGNLIQSIPHSAGDEVAAIRFDRIQRDLDANYVEFDDLELQGAPLPARTIRLYLDENPIPVLEILNADSNSGEAPDSITMGAKSSAGAQDLYFDWVTATDMGAFAPGEEVAVLGHSLIPAPPPPITTIIEARTAEFARTVELTEGIVTGAFWNDMGRIGFAVQLPNKLPGIRVVSDAAVVPGLCVQRILGGTGTDDGQKVIYAGCVEQNLAVAMPESIEPIAMQNKASGGRAQTGQPAVYDNVDTGERSGLMNNIGMLVRLYGRVTGTWPTGGFDGFFYIDDGSKLWDGSGFEGIRCRVPAYEDGTPMPLPYWDDYVEVTGVIGTTLLNGIPVRCLYTTNWHSYIMGWP